MRHDSTRIYQRSLELVRLTAQVIEQLPHGYGFLVDQLKRASSSVPLNFSEGFAKGTAREQARYFRIARGSAYEVSAALDVAHCFNVISETHLAKGKDLCDHLAAMLTKFKVAPGRASSPRGATRSWDTRG